jgi:predicted kinase
MGPTLRVAMKTLSAGARLIIICGLPGSGKTTRARWLEAHVGAACLDPDEGMAALALDLWDEAARARVEALQWALARTLLSRGLTVAIEWGTWARAERDALRTGARALVLGSCGAPRQRRETFKHSSSNSGECSSQPTKPTAHAWRASTGARSRSC